MEQDIKVIENLEVLKPLLPSGSKVLVGGFMSVGGPVPLLHYCSTFDINNLHIYCNDAGHHNEGVGALLSRGRVSTLTTSHVGLNPDATTLVQEGSLDINLVPQGTLVEQIRAGGAGLGGVLTPTGLGTEVEKDKRRIVIENQEYLLELPIRGNVALLMAHVADTQGNLIINKTCRNFNEVMATAADTVIVQANEIVSIGDIDPDHVRVPHIFVDYIVPRTLLKDYEGVIS